MKREYLDSRKNYSSPKITQQLNKKGMKVSQKTVTPIIVSFTARI
ncbi:hypothetical protein ACFFHM_17820 [Halalkalibacter kiskunsagensis]|uniref:HTH-like domain-containing protein n=1 Tax=Halalkalibacter kiskunsagensis TaxID=1548599 RepID=A0ABV6KGW2_9BACI